MRQFHRILAPTDFSPYSDEGLRFAADLAENFGSTLIVMHVLKPEELKEKKSRPLPAGYLDNIFKETGLEAEAHCRNILTSGQRDLPIRAVITKGDPAVEIVRVAHEERCDIVVLATHGRTGLNHVMVGSIAERVVRTAACPVLTIRPAGHNPAKQ